MAVVDYPSLQAAVANWMARPGNPDFTGNVTDFIQFAEARINFGSDDQQFPSPPLRVRQMEVPATSITILASSNSVLLPSDFLELRRIYAAGTPQRKLTYVTPNQMDATISNTQNTPPQFFTIMGGFIYTAAPVDTTNTIVFGYYQKLPPLSLNATNWLLLAHPALYLAGANLEGSLFVGDDDGAGKWARVFSSHVRSFQKQDLKGRFSGDALQMKTDTGNP
jgi:hypothetical protein